MDPDDDYPSDQDFVAARDPYADASSSALEYMDTGAGYPYDSDFENEPSMEIDEGPFEGVGYGEEGHEYEDDGYDGEEHENGGEGYYGEEGCSDPPVDSTGLQTGRPIREYGDPTANVLAFLLNCPSADGSSTIDVKMIQGKRSGKDSVYFLVCNVTTADFPHTPPNELDRRKKEKRIQSPAIPIVPT